MYNLSNMLSLTATELAQGHNDWLFLCQCSLGPFLSLLDYLKQTIFVSLFPFLFNIIYVI